MHNKRVIYHCPKLYPVPHNYLQLNFHYSDLITSHNLKYSNISLLYKLITPCNAVNRSENYSRQLLQCPWLVLLQTKMVLKSDQILTTLEKSKHAKFWNQKNTQSLWNKLSLCCKQSVTILIHIISNCQQKSKPFSLLYSSTVLHRFYYYYY
jgi:hypothetical protein